MCFEKLICPECASVNEIPIHQLGMVVACPSCKTENVANKDQTGAKTAKEESRDMKHGCLILIVILILPALGLYKGCGWISERNAEKEAKEEQIERLREQLRADEGDTHGAWAYMQIAVKKKLKSPRGASFPFGGHRDVKFLGSERYRVKSYVDAKNSFNAEIRTHFEGVIKKVSGGWQIESLNLLN